MGHATSSRRATTDERFALGEISRASPVVPAGLCRIAKVSDRPSRPSSRVRRLGRFGALTPNSPSRPAVTALVPDAEAGAAGAWPCDSEAIQVAIGSCRPWRCRSVAAASTSASADCDDCFRPIPLKNSYGWSWGITFGGLQWSLEFVAFNNGRSTRSHLGTVDPETLCIEFFNGIGQVLPFAVAAEFSGKRSFARAHRSGGERGSPRRLRLHGRRPFARNRNLVHCALTLSTLGINVGPICAIVHSFCRAAQVSWPQAAGAPDTNAVSSLHPRPIASTAML